MCIPHIGIISVNIFCGYKVEYNWEGKVNPLFNEERQIYMTFLLPRRKIRINNKVLEAPNKKDREDN